MKAEIITAILAAMFVGALSLPVTLPRDIGSGAEGEPMPGGPVRVFVVNERRPIEITALCGSNVTFPCPEE